MLYPTKYLLYKNNELKLENMKMSPGNKQNYVVGSIIA